MVHPLVPPDEFIMPVGTVSHLSGPLGGLSWKSSRDAFDQYCLNLASGTELLKACTPAKEELHTLLTRQVSGTPAEVAITFALNATEALTKILQCIEGTLDATHNIITPGTAYPSLRVLAHSLQQKREAEVRHPIGTTDGVIAAIDEQTRLIIVEEFDTQWCELIDLARIAEEAHKVGARLIADVSQLIGIFPLDFRHFDAAVATAYKGLGGISNGCTPLFLNRARWRAEDIQPPYAGRNSVLLGNGQDFPFKHDIGDRLQPGGLPWLNVFLMLDAQRNMQRHHLELQDTARHIVTLGDEIVQALENLARKNEHLTLHIVSARNPQLRGPHVTVKMLRNRAESVCERLVSRGVYLSCDNVGLRFGPRLHNGSADVKIAVEEHLEPVLLDMGYGPYDPTWVGM